MTNTKEYLNEAVAATKKLNSKMNQVAGKGGILQRLNERHIAALNALIANPKDAGAMDSLLNTLKREERVIVIMKEGLIEYEKILHELISRVGRYFKKDLVNGVKYLLSVSSALYHGLNKIYNRNYKEMKIIHKAQPDELDDLLKVIKSEERNLRSMIKKCKPEELGSLNSIFNGMIKGRVVGFVNSQFLKGPRPSGELLDEFPGYNSADVDGAIMAIGTAVITIPLSITETLLNVMYGFTIDDQELMTEVRKLKKAA
ncbi:hypothetical protein KY330_05935 [Candidatus Woesearchaeota archaeon]|nr:hypothetical protein [Candidatus Woesearchaeota archaeon]